MAALPTLYRMNKTRYVNADGKRCRSSDPGAIKKTEQSKNWYADIPVIETPAERIERRKAGRPKPKPKRVKLCTDKRAAQKMLAELVDSAEREAAGLIDYRSQGRTALADLLDGYRRYLKVSKNDSDDYIEQTINRIQKLLVGCRMVHVADIDCEDVMAWLSEQRQEPEQEALKVSGTAKDYKAIAKAFGVAERTVTYWRQKGAPIVPRKPNKLKAIAEWLAVFRGKRSMSASTADHYVTALKCFGNWMVRPRKCVESNPFDDLEKLNDKTDIRKKRRALSDADFAGLINTAASSTWKFRGLDGKARALLYTFAAYTGLRASEIASLTPKSFTFGEFDFVVVDGAYTKNNEQADIPLRADLSAALAAIVDSVGPGESVWPGTWYEDGSEMIQVDLEQAGIPYTNERGDFDFHALRHQFITSLARAGVSLRSAQELARHSKPELTANVYTHLSVRDTVRDVEKLPAVPGADFGRVNGLVENVKEGESGRQSRDAQQREKEPAESRKPRKTQGLTGLSLSDADGTRTRNLRIDSPGL